MTEKQLNPGELKIDILCSGLRISDSARTALEGIHLPSSRAGLGSGLELVIPGPLRDVWVNAPVAERFVAQTPYCLEAAGGGQRIRDTRNGFTYPVRLVPRPGWYEARTASGLRMGSVATLQGTCLSILIGDRCRFWKATQNCVFCGTGLDSSWEEERPAGVDDVVETALAARAESGITFVLLQSGYHGAGGLRDAFPYLRALKEKAGLIVGVQFTPERDLALYDEALALGADHLSFSFEFYNPEYFRRYLPGKAEAIGRSQFFRALEHCARRMGKGRVSGQIIAGIEPLADTLHAIEYIGCVGAYPLVCIFRPLLGTALEDHPPPAFRDMEKVFRHVYRTCRAHSLPIDVAPNIYWSLSLQPEDTLYLARDAPADRMYQSWIRLLKLLLRPYFYCRMHRFGAR